MSESALKGYALGRQNYAQYRVCTNTLRVLRKQHRALSKPEAREAFRIGWEHAAQGVTL